MSENGRVSAADLFELHAELPSVELDAARRQLMGFEQRYEPMARGLKLLLEPDTLEGWAKQHHGDPSLPIVSLVKDRYPLVILHGDVGTGKTAFAEAASTRLCAELATREGQLFKLSTRVRGTGHVGHMSYLINQAFAIVEAEAGKHRSAFLIIDEADSLASNRDNGHSHHEDKVAVNTLIQKIDDVRKLGGRVLVFLCTNRLGALDPAIVRRAGQIERFDRPDDAQRQALLENDLQGLGIAAASVTEVVGLTGTDANEGLPFTYSDMRTRLLPEALLRAYPDRPMTADDLTAVAEQMQPSPSLDGA